METTQNFQHAAVLVRLQSLGHSEAVRHGSELSTFKNFDLFPELP